MGELDITVATHSFNVDGDYFTPSDIIIWNIYNFRQIDYKIGIIFRAVYKPELRPD